MLMTPKRKRSWAAADDADGRWEVGDGRLVVVARRWGACENVNLERQGKWITMNE